MKNYLQKLYLRKELLPEAITMLLLVILAVVIPKSYSAINSVGVRLTATFIVLVASMIGIIFLPIRLAKRNKHDRKFKWVRFAVSLVATIAFVLITASQTAKYGIQGAISSNGVYPVDTSGLKWAPALNSLVFAFGSQLFFTSISGGYEELRPFFIKLTKCFVYISLPLAVVMYLVTRFMPEFIPLEMVITLVLWFTALSANELVSTDIPEFILNRVSPSAIVEITYEEKGEFSAIAGTDVPSAEENTGTSDK